MPRRLLACASAAALAFTLVVAPSPASAGQTTEPAVPGPVFTLLTGDKVRLDSSQDATVVHDAGPQDDVVFQQIDDSLYAFTGQAVRLVGEGKLDRELFNLTRLAEYGYDDAHVQQLPVIATYERSATQRAAPKTATTKRELASIGGRSLAVDKARTPTAWAELTSAGNGIQKVWLDGKARASLDVSVPAVGTPAAWSAGYTGKDVKVAVLDTGIDAAHPDFAGRIVAAQTFAPGDALHDGYGHGTHVASIAAGSGAASGGKYRGAAPDAQLVIGKVLDDYGYGTDSEIIAGMEWAAAEGAKVVNLSIGGMPTDGTDPLAQALNRISDESGALFVVAAGNRSQQEAHLVDSPGSADRALTVGNVSKWGSHGLDHYSSAGPRLGDNAVKPEITAPGGNILAARAAGTNLGDGDENYQTMSGTSMASPHVAGGAAILAQQHPDWSRDQIRDALVSTADPHSAYPVTQQGGGMLDLAQATAGGLVTTGTLNLGKLAPPYPETVTGTVTLRNTGSQPVHTDLGLTLSKMDKELLKKTSFAPGDAVTVTPPAIDLAPGAATTVTVTVKLAGLETGSYYGYLEAKTGDTVAARTTLGWTKDYQRARLKVCGIDRDGVPANTTYYSWWNLMDLETGQSWVGWWENGVGYLDMNGPDPLMPVGRYALMTNISGFTTQEPYYHLSETLGGEPELVLDQDRELTFDARKAKRVELKTHLPAEPVANLGVGVQWSRVLPLGYQSSRVMGQRWAGLQEIYLSPSVSTAATGTFALTFNAHLVAPPLTMRAFGKGLSELHPWYPREGYGDCDQYELCVSPFRSPGVYQVVDGGSGTSADLAAARVRGKVVLVHEAWDLASSPPEVDQVTADAAAAGAAGVLILATYPGPPVRVVRNHTTVPVAILPHEEGKRLATALRSGPVVVNTGGQPISPYIYDLILPEQGRLPADTVIESTPRELATVTARYHADVPGTLYTATPDAWVFASSETKFRAPFVRTEFYSPGTRRRSISYGAYGEGENGTHVYAAGDRAIEDFVSVPVAPGPGPGWTALTADNRGGFLGLSLEQFRVGTGHRVMRFNGSAAPEDALRVRYSRDGQVLCEVPYVAGCTVSPQAGRYRLEMDTKQWTRPISVAAHTVWEFDARFDSREEILPMVDVGYDIPVELDNTVRAGDTYPIRIIPRYQAGYSGHGPFTVEAWVSHDDGATWTPLGSRKTSGNERARFDSRTPRDAQYVTLRVRATDSAGNSVDQTITRAWKVSRR